MSPGFARVLTGAYRTPCRRSSGRDGEPYSRITLCDDVAGVASAATRACAGPPLRFGPSSQSGALLRRVPPAPARHDLHVAGGE